MSVFNHTHYIFGIITFIIGACLSALWFAKSSDIIILKNTETIVDKNYLEALERVIAQLKKRGALKNNDEDE